VATILFVCTANRGRSVMSAAFAERLAAGRHRALSAGSEAHPANAPHPAVVQAMHEVGIDISEHRAQRLTSELAAEVDAVVTMGCGDACPVIPGKKQFRVDWDLTDPRNEPLDRVRAIGDDIERRVRELVAELDRTPTAATARWHAGREIDGV
jgi:protein-tyrosine-phosphatase